MVFLHLLILFIHAASSVYIDDCDILIAGGSTASLAAALAAADELKFRGSKQTVCLLEPTSIAGGQLASSLITAIDFGHFNRLQENLPYEFVRLLESVGWPEKNPGECWVSTICYLLDDLEKNYLNEAIAQRENLRVYTNTVVKSLNQSDRYVTALEAITREPVSSSLTYAESVEDWYSRENSTRFVKTILNFRNLHVVVEGTYSLFFVVFYRTHKITYSHGTW